jgi:hypothetical protein
MGLSWEHWLADRGLQVSSLQGHEASIYLLIAFAIDNYEPAYYDILRNIALTKTFDSATAAGHQGRSCSTDWRRMS